MSLRFIFPFLLIGGGVALAYSSAHASAKKKKVDKALDLGLDDEGPEPPTELPVPPESDKSVPSNPVTQELFTEWWYQSGNPEIGVMGFWVPYPEPPAGTDWLIPQIGYEDFVIVTTDGAFWYWFDGWHPASVLVYDYDTWYNANK